MCVYEIICREAGGSEEVVVVPGDDCDGQGRSGQSSGSEMKRTVKTCPLMWQSHRGPAACMLEGSSRAVG